MPPEKLEEATIELAEKLMKKSPAVLRATKQAIRHVRTMDVAQAYDYLAEKGKAIKVADQEDSYNTGLRQFLDEKSYKPTFEPFRLGTMLTDQRAQTGGEEIATPSVQGSEDHDATQASRRRSAACLPPPHVRTPRLPSSTGARPSP